MPAGTLNGFRVRRDDIGWVGADMHRPECVLAERDGTLWVSDSRGGVLRVAADGAQSLLAPADANNAQAHPGADWTRKSLPNGLAFDRDGSLIIADVSAGKVNRMTREGSVSIVCDAIDGKPLGFVNFVLRDSKGRIWFTVTTSSDPMEAMNRRIADGYIGLIDRNGVRRVADGFCGTNEIRFDAREEWLYVVESYACRITRLRVATDGALSDRETFGPERIGPMPDGCTFDALGNLWVTCTFSDRVIAITPEGEAVTLLDEGDSELIALVAERLANGSMTADIMLYPSKSATPWITSLTFGGADLKTVYLGSHHSGRIACFRSPVAGQPMIHWHEGRSAASGPSGSGNHPDQAVPAGAVMPSRRDTPSQE